MPITLDKKLPAVDILRSENIFVMDDVRATHQDIRPMNVLILNLMPTKGCDRNPALTAPWPTRPCRSM